MTSQEHDELGFLLPQLSSAQQAARARARKGAGSSGARKWAEAREKARLPDSKTLKKLLRKVRSPLCCSVYST